jgi:hypothetical protein
MKNKGPAKADAEFRLHAAAVTYLQRVAPDLLVFHPASGELRNAATARRLKAMGVLAAPSILLPWA